MCDQRIGIGMPMLREESEKVWLYARATERRAYCIVQILTFLATSDVRFLTQTRRSFLGHPSAQGEKCSGGSLPADHRHIEPGGNDQACSPC